MYYIQLVLNARTPRLNNALEGPTVDHIRTHALISEWYPRIKLPSQWAQNPTYQPTNTHHIDLGPAIATTTRLDSHHSPTLIKKFRAHAIPLVDHDGTGDGHVIVNTIDKSPALQTGTKTREKNNVLWRYERNPYGDSTLLVTSSTHPQHLDDVLPNANYEIRETTPEYPCVTPGDRVNIDVTLNTVLGKNRKPILDHRRRLEWGTRFIQANAGVTILDDDAGQPDITVRRAYGHLRNDIQTATRVDGKQVPLTLARYRATCVITDVEKYRDAIHYGIGKARAYGSGMVLAQRSY